jgi:hypothetical protein
VRRRVADQSGQTASHLVYSWSGTPFDIAFQHGRTLRREIIAETKGAIAVFAQNRGWTEARALKFALSEWEPLFERLTPRAIEETKGIAAGGGFDYPWTFFVAVQGGTKVTPLGAGACTAFACGKVTTQGGKVLLGDATGRLVCIECVTGRTDVRDI